MLSLDFIRAGSLWENYRALSEQLAIPLKRLGSFFLYIVSIYKGAIEKNRKSDSKNTAL
jgi:hypothetical protein